MAMQGSADRRRLADRLRLLGIMLFGLAALALLGASALAFAGILPWLPPVSPAAASVPGDPSGMWLQLGLTLITFALVYGMASHLRLSRLESGQRSFADAIEDVLRARRLAQPAVRTGSPAEGGARTRVFLNRQQASFAALSDDLAQAQRACEDLRQRLDEIESGTLEARNRLAAMAATLNGAPPRDTRAAPPPAADNVIHLGARQAASRLPAPVHPERPLPRR